MDLVSLKFLVFLKRLSQASMINGDKPKRSLQKSASHKMINGEPFDTQNY
jgi:hypothetical protein